MNLYLLFQETFHFVVTKLRLLPRQIICMWSPVKEGTNCIIYFNSTFVWSFIASALQLLAAQPTHQGIVLLNPQDNRFVELNLLGE